ncbi:MAG: hypothetical protein ACRCXT_00190 [Paraclostridium sp.]
MGEINRLLEEIKKILTETEFVLKEEFDYESNIKEISINYNEESIVIEECQGKCFYYDICDAYTSLIKLVKLYNNDKLIENYKRLKEISVQADLF